MFKLDFTGQWYQENPNNYKNPLWNAAGQVPWTSTTLEHLLSRSLDEFFDQLSIFIDRYPSPEAANDILKIHFKGPDSRGVYPVICVVPIKENHVHPGTTPVRLPSTRSLPLRITDR